MKFANSIRLGALAVALNSVPAVHAAVHAAVRAGGHDSAEHQDLHVDDGTDAESSTGNLRRAQGRGEKNNRNRGLGNNNKNQGGGRRPRQDEPFDETTCKAVIFDVQGLPEGEDHLKLACQDAATGATRDLDVDANWKRNALATRALEPGDEIDIGEGAILGGADGKIHPKNKTPRGIAKRKKQKGAKQPNGNNKNKRRGLAEVTGTKSVLAVMVTTAGDGNTYSQSRNKLKNDLFEDYRSLKTTYSDCSHGKLEIVKADDKQGLSTNIVDGIVEITVPNASNETDSVVRPAIGEELARQFSTSAENLADHVMYCLPPGTMDGIAYAGADDWNSVYNDVWCNFISTQMHEIGHNLNLAHSNEGINVEGGEYMDQTGWMGLSYPKDDQGMCFNNAKSWQLGWFFDRQLLVSRGQCYDDLELVGQVNYDPNDPVSRNVLVKINSLSTDVDYYLGFNHAVKHNRDTKEARNYVTIQSAAIEGKSGTPGGGYAPSELVAKLRYAGQKWTQDVGGSIVTVLVKAIDTDEDNGFATVQISHGEFACVCSSDDQCDDGYACNGVEFCNMDTEKCEAGQPVPGFKDVTIAVTTDGYSQETSWQLKHPDGNVLLNRGVNAGETLTNLATYTDTIPLCPSDAGNFEFTVADIYGDGMCCDYGDGSYSVKLGGEIIASGGKFASTTETTYFAVVPPVPTVSPVAAPTGSPTTASPTGATTGSPTTTSPTEAPSETPVTAAPTDLPTVSPSTDSPTAGPTSAPLTTSPTGSPSASHTASPTESPSKAPTTSTTTTTSASSGPTTPYNLAYGKVATQSSTCASGGIEGDASHAIDGDTNGVYNDGSVSLTCKELVPWWEVDLESSEAIHSIIVYNRAEYSNRLTNAIVQIIDGAGSIVAEQSLAYMRGKVSKELDFGGAVGSKVRIQGHTAHTMYISLAEVKVLGAPPPTPSASSTEAPTFFPRSSPTGSPSAFPTEGPTESPSKTPTTSTTTTTTSASSGPTTPYNVAFGKVVAQSSTCDGGDASRAIDGDTNNVFDEGSVSTTCWETNPWWVVDLGSPATIYHVIVYNIVHPKNRLSHATVQIIDGPNDNVIAELPLGSMKYAVSRELDFGGVVGSKVRVVKNGMTGAVNLAEVEVLGTMG